MFKNFVEAYKVILSIKKTNPIHKKNAYKINQIILLSITFVAVFMMVGYMLQTLHSFNYTFLSLNIIVTFTYITWLISKNKHDRYQMNQSYDILPVLIVEGSHFFAHWLLFNVLIYYIYLSFVGSIIIFLILMIGSILANSILLIVSYKENPKQMRSTLWSSLTLFICQLSIIQLLTIRSIPLNYALSLVMTISLYYSIQIAKKYRQKTLYFASSIFLTALVTASLTKIYTIESFDLFSFDFHNSQIIKIDYEIDPLSKFEHYRPWRVYVDETNIYYVEYAIVNGYVEQSVLNVFDRSGNLKTKIEYPVKSAYVIKSNKGFYIQVYRYPNCLLEEACDGDHADDIYIDVYRLSSDLEFELIFERETGKHVDYFYETEDVSIVFQDDYIGHYNEVTKTMQWQHISNLEGFSFRTKTHYYLVDDGVAYSNFTIGNSLNVLPTLPFWDQYIIAYNDGYVISYQGDYEDKNFVLINIDTQLVKPLTNLERRIFREFAIVDQYLIFDQFHGQLGAYHLDKGYVIVGDLDYFYASFQMSFRISGHLINDQIVIQELDFSKGVRKTIRQSSISTPWITPVIVVSFMTIFYCMRLIKSWTSDKKPSENEEETAETLLDKLIRESSYPKT